jgi:UBA/TS-N domain
MGFDAVQARDALVACDGSVDAAIDHLLSSVVSDNPGSSSTSTSSSMITSVASSVSQYTVPDGRSACTCIALATASQMMSRIESQEPTILSSEVLVTAVNAGVAAYHKVQQALASSSTNSVLEHTSVEDIFRVSDSLQLFPPISGINNDSIRQGLLLQRGSMSHPQSLQSLLHECQQSRRWTCVVMTKPPETVLLCLPPKENSSAQYIFVDSHPRPPGFFPDEIDTSRGSGSYGRFHDSLQSLIQDTVSIVFPVTDLGPDVPEMMAMMYNSFDLYPLSTSTPSMTDTRP